jgi:hypothetical protein
MIAIVEQDLRARLGDNIFGVDDDTLENITLSILAQRGWTLACLEVNLEGALLRRLANTGNPTYLGGNNPLVRPQDLAAGTKSIRRQFDASTILGVAYYQEDEKQIVHIHLITPLGETEHHLNYGGHPRNARRWAGNMALDSLRRSALELG